MSAHAPQILRSVGAATPKGMFQGGAAGPALLCERIANTDGTKILHCKAAIQHKHASSRAGSVTRTPRFVRSQQGGDTQYVY